MKRYLLQLVALSLLPIFLSCTKKVKKPNTSVIINKQMESKESSVTSVTTGAAQTALYLPLLKGKRVGMVVNQTSLIAGSHSIDKLKALGITIVKAFGPEHGFRGQASAGAKVQSGTDPQTGISVVSLYGSHYKPTKEDVSGLDIMVFDIQDVGARFYTYISTLHYVMEACAENGIPLIVLDRPNPNGFYIDGPILETKYASFIGMHPVPIVHGMTIGEYAKMINGEGWLKNKVRCNLKVIQMKGYKHSMPYTLPVKPSPNLNTQQSILLYPSLCLFEGTIISQGRGTYFPFQVLGAPELVGKYTFSFKPVSIPGMSESPLHQNQSCYGLDLRNFDTGIFQKTGKLNLQWLIELYKAYPDKEKFFDFKQSKQMNNFDKLAGTQALRNQIIAGKTESEIRKSWEPGLIQFKEKRKKYLLYQ
ncbi:exo-beta-N-acetylmuramidase NamZ family protein [Desertivirga arenae]|uniref:exo-beta-N-acetylmuramidase NamZ family protein n=1 Tax=Desertivirga arenae TaxID=2810309 RepID=UPI001A97859B